jgi:hypothetical protein
VVLDFIDVRPENMPALESYWGTVPYPKTDCRARIHEWIKESGNVEVEESDSVEFIKDEEPLSISLSEL